MRRAAAISAEFYLSHRSFGYAAARIESLHSFVSTPPRQWAPLDQQPLSPIVLQIYILAGAPQRVQLQNRKREDLHVETGWYVTAANRRNFIFPIFGPLPAEAQIAWDTWMQEFDWNVELAQNDHEEVVVRAITAFSQEDFDGKAPGRKATHFSDLHPRISEIEPMATYALSEFPAIAKRTSPLPPPHPPLPPSRT